MKKSILVAITCCLAGCYVGEQPKITLKMGEVVEDYNNLRIIRRIDGTTQFYVKETKLTPVGSPEPAKEPTEPATAAPTMYGKSKWDIYPIPE